MNQHEPSLQQRILANLCRTCMTEIEYPNLTSLFSVLTKSNNDEALNSILYKCTSIEVCYSDILPQSICRSCLEKLVTCYLYRELCFDTQIRLTQLYESLKEPISFVEPSTEPVCQNSIEAATSKLIEYPSVKSAENNSENEPAKWTESCDLDNLGCDQNSFKETDEDWTCATCSKKFCSKHSLTRHFKTHTEVESLKCPFCKKAFTRETDVKRHLITHTGEKPYVCSVCPCSFTQSGTRAYHMRIKHGIVDGKKPIKEPPQEKSFLCSICGKCFRHKSTLTVHLRRHVGEKPYECQICKLRFVSSGRLTSHSRIHTGERPYVCHICNKNFAHATVLSTHLKGHTGQRQFKCSYCGKRFSKPYYLNIHIRQHTGEKPLKCSNCNKSFACPKNLKAHEKIHSNEKPYLCVQCGKSFRRASHLKVHMKLHGKV